MDEEDFLRDAYGGAFYEQVQRYRSHKRTMVAAWAQDAAIALMQGFHPQDCRCGLETLPEPVKTKALGDLIHEVISDVQPDGSTAIGLMARMGSGDFAFEFLAKHPSLPKHIAEAKRLYERHLIRNQERDERLLAGKGAPRFEAKDYKDGDYDYPLMEVLMSEEEPVFWDDQDFDKG